MGILDKILGTKQLSGAARPDQWLVDWFNGGQSTSAGEVITEQTALTCAAVKAAVSILAETVATLPLDVFQSMPDGGRQLALNHPMYPLLHDEPNKETSSFIWRESKQGHLGTWGNGYSEIQRDGRDDVIALWQRSPDPARTKPFRKESDGEIWYEARDEHGNRESDIPARNMLHIPGFGFDGLSGYSPIRLLRESIGISKGAERFAAETFANNATPSGVITVPDELSEDAFKRTEGSFNKAFGSHDKRHKVALLEGGAQFAATQMKPGDVQMIEARRFSVEDVARGYRIPLYLLQELTNGTSYASIVELGREFIVYTMMPWFKRWQAEINRKLLGDGYFCEFNVRAFMQGDHAARGDFYRKLFSVGGMTTNRILSLENENTIGSEGDRRFVPLNMIPLDRVDDYVDAIITKKKTGGSAPNKGPGGAVNESQGVNEWQAKAEQAAAAMYTDATRRMLTKEGNAAKRAANEPSTFVVWLDSFYEKHAKLCEEAFLPAALAGYDDLEMLTSRHIEASKSSLLAASECKIDELSKSVTACVAGWGDRIKE